MPARIISSVSWKNDWKVTGSDPIDKGRFDVTKNPDDLYVFRVASLRNAAMTPPYFHDGSVATLPEAVKVMARVQLGVTLNDIDTRVSRKPSQKYLKFSDQPIWLSLSVG